MSANSAARALSSCPPPLGGAASSTSGGGGPGGGGGGGPEAPAAEDGADAQQDGSHSQPYRHIVVYRIIMQ